MNILAKTLALSDPEIDAIINAETKRQDESIELIASENFVSRAVMIAQGSVLTNKYAEGYPGKRYYEGCHEVDKAETLAIERAKKLFNCSYANVQPHSGSQANQTVFLSLLQPGDTILAMSMDSGGHLTHGAKPNLSGKWFKPVHYSVSKKDYLLDYDEIEALAMEYKPKLIIAGYSCYSRQLDFAKFRKIADKVSAYLVADIAHIAGLVAANQHPSPIPYAHAVTSTTHKTLRGPRGGLILSNNLELGKKFDLALFPGLQGGPLMHTIAAKAVAFNECLSDEYCSYIKQVAANAKILGETLKKAGIEILTGGTDNHMVIVDLRSKGLTGKAVSEALDKVGITCNKNNIPFDDKSPFVTSGIRLGTPACTTRGFKEAEFIKVGEIIANLINNMQDSDDIANCAQEIHREVQILTRQFPLKN